MLKLNGLTVEATLGGTVTITAGEIIGPRYFGATSRQKLYITTDADANLLVVEDQRIHGEAFGGRFALAEALQKCTGAVEVAVL